MGLRRERRGEGEIERESSRASSIGKGRSFFVQLESRGTPRLLALTSLALLAAAFLSPLAT